MMEVKTTAEEVTVVQKAPLVSTTKPNVSEEFGNDFVEALPHHTRDNIHRDMLGSVAGSVGNRMRGGGANQTLVTQDGFDMGAARPDHLARRSSRRRRSRSRPPATAPTTPPPRAACSTW